MGDKLRQISLKCSCIMLAEGGNTNEKKDRKRRKENEKNYFDVRYVDIYEL